MLWGRVLPTTGVIHGAEQGSAAHRFICAVALGGVGRQSRALQELRLHPQQCPGHGGWDNPAARRVWGQVWSPGGSPRASAAPCARPKGAAAPSSVPKEKPSLAGSQGAQVPLGAEIIFDFVRGEVPAALTEGSLLQPQHSGAALPALGASPKYPGSLAGAGHGCQGAGLLKAPVLQLAGGLQQGEGWQALLQGAHSCTDMFICIQTF